MNCLLYDLMLVEIAALKCDFVFVNCALNHHLISNLNTSRKTKYI